MSCRDVYHIFKSMCQWYTATARAPGMVRENIQQKDLVQMFEDFTHLNYSKYMYAYDLAQRFRVGTEDALCIF